MLKKFFQSNLLKAAVLILILRVVVLYLSIHNIPDIGMNSQTWIFWRGGDEGEYFNSAKALLSWHFIPNTFPLGFSILLAPYVWIAKAQSLEDIFKPMVVFNSVIVYAVTTISVYLIANKFFKDKLKSWFTAGLFLILPYLFYLLFLPFAQHNKLMYDFLITRYGQFQNLLVLSDPLANLLVYATLYLMMDLIIPERRDLFIPTPNPSSFDPAQDRREGNKDDGPTPNPSREGNILKYCLLGFLSSWAFITRLQNLIILPIYFIIILYQKKFKELFYYSVSTLPLIILQLYANLVSNGSIFKTYVSSDIFGKNIPSFSIWYIFKILTYINKYGILLYIPLILSFLFVGFGAYLMIKKNKILGIILVSYLIINVVFVSFFEATFRNPRYFLPAVPVFFMLIIEVISYLWNKPKLNLAS